MTWRTHIACPDRFSPTTSAFLDDHHTCGKLRKSGTFELKHPVGELVPFELLPIRIKRLVNAMPLNENDFVSSHSYNSAITKLYVYGYLPDAGRGIEARNKYWKDFRRKMCIDQTSSGV